jgi:hypothetical protein
MKDDHEKEKEWSEFIWPKYQQLGRFLAEK